MLTIRLQRTGTKNKPAFRIVLAEAQRSASKLAKEVLGHYNPKSKEFAIKDQERLTYWLGQHVSVSPTVHNLLVEKKILADKKVKAWAPKKKPASPDASQGGTAAEASVVAEAKPAKAEAPAQVETAPAAAGTAPESAPAP